MKIYNFEQGTPEWHRIRKGRLTASQASRLLTPTGKDSSQWESYVIELVAESICPDEPPAFTGNMHTERGNMLESEARWTFAESMLLDVREVGFMTRDDGVVGLSPDGLIYHDEVPVAGLELKCPLAKNHLAYLVAGGVPSQYVPQVHFSMAATGLPWYFMSYCPGMASHIAKAEPDDYTAKIASAIDRFVELYKQRRPELLAIAGKGGGQIT